MRPWEGTLIVPNPLFLHPNPAKPDKQTDGLTRVGVDEGITYEPVHTMTDVMLAREDNTQILSGDENTGGLVTPYR